MTGRIEIFPDEIWAAGVGARLAERVAAARGLRLCLPTGNTPVGAYAAFAALGTGLGETEVFLLDEFGLPKEHPARCDRMLQRSLLDRVHEPPAMLHTIAVNADDPDLAAEEYGKVVDAGGLDLTLLGLGTNGHIGLNEPGTRPDDSTRVVRLHRDTVANAAAYGHGPAPEWGITVGMRSILASREIWLMVTGAHKAEILKRTLEGSIRTDVPASYLQSHPNLVVLADRSAAANLTDRR